MDEKYLEGSEAIIVNLTEWRVKAARAALSARPPEGFDGSCPECGEIINPARVELGFYTCIDCQRAKEHIKKAGGR